MRYLIISTYPKEGSLNSGDDLLEKSLTKLISGYDSTAHITVCNITEKRMILPDMKTIDVVAGCFGIVYPTEWYKRNIHKILSGVCENDIRCYFIAISGIWPGTKKQLAGLTMDAECIKMLKKNKKNTMILTRDYYTLNVLRKNEIECKSCIGDIALYDSNFIGKQLRKSDNISKIAISMPHNQYWQKKAIYLAIWLRKQYKNRPQIYITLHGLTDLSKYKRLFEKENVQVLKLYGGCERLSAYDEMDLHIGFRLHAHIYMLRTRKPSFLIAEDSRSAGHIETFKGGTNGIPNLIKVIYDVLPNDLVKMLTEKYHINRFFAKRKVYKNINNFIKNDYVENIKLLELIDCYYDKKIVPLLSKMTRRKS